MSEALTLLGGTSLTPSNPDWLLGVLPHLLMTTPAKGGQLVVETILNSPRAVKEPLLKDILKGKSVLIPTVYTRILAASQISRPL